MTLSLKYNKYLIFVFVILLSSYPYVFNRMGPFPDEKYVHLVFFFIALVILFTIKQLQWLPKILTICCFIQILTWFFFSIYHNDLSYFTRIFYILFTYIILLIIHNKQSIRTFISNNNKLIYYLSLFGFIIFFIILIFNVSPLFYIENVDGRTIGCYILSCASKVFSTRIPRMTGFFDEPGALAYWGIYALIFNRLFFNNKKFEIVLMISLLTTLSLAYIIQLMVYILLFYVTNIRKILPSVIILLMVLFAVYKTKDTNFDIYKATIGRLEFDHTRGTIKGDNRSLMAEDAKMFYKLNPIMGYGPNNIVAKGYTYVADNPYENLAHDGIVGTFMTYLPLLIVFYMGRHNKKYFFASIILLLGFLQRPFHIVILYYLMLYSLLILTLNDLKISPMISKK